MGDATGDPRSAGLDTRFAPSSNSSGAEPKTSLVPEPGTASPKPLLSIREMLREVARIQEGMAYQSSEGTQEYLDEYRNGACHEDDGSTSH